MLDLSTDPRTWNWRHGIIPPVEDVAWDCLILLVAPDFMGLVAPGGNELNPLRWYGDGFPNWGTGRPSGWWVYLRDGSEPRPPHIETWAEFEARLERQQRELNGESDG